MYFEDAKNIKKNIDHQNFMIDNGSALSPAYFFLYYGFTIIIKFGTQVSRKILNLCDNIEWSQIRPYDKISAIVSDNAANIAAARSEISSKYPTIMNLKCIAHCFNLISQDIIKIPFAERLLRRCSIVVSFFKASHIAGSLLRDAIEEKKIQGGILKTYVKTRWSTTYDCVNLVLRCKEAFNYVSYLFLLFIK